jgi:hypothetical protein
MTPKEKAQQLINAFVPHVRWKMGQEDVLKRAKECALIAVDEILSVLPQQEYLEDRGEYSENRERTYWQQVKQEIEKL